MLGTLALPEQEAENDVGQDLIVRLPAFYSSSSVHSR